MFEIIKEEDKKYKIGKEIVDLSLIDEAIHSFYLRFNPYDKRIKFGAELSYEDGYGNGYTEEKDLADSINDNKNELFQFIENRCSINNKKFIKTDLFFNEMQYAFDNIKIDEMGSFVIIPENFSLKIKKEAFIELCGYIDNAIDVNYGLFKLEEAFKETKQNYLNKEAVLKEIEENQTIQSKKYTINLN